MDRESIVSLARKRLQAEKDPSNKRIIQSIIDELESGFGSPGGCGDRVVLSVARGGPTQ